MFRRWVKLAVCLIFVFSCFFVFSPSAYAVEWSTTDSTNLKNILSLLQTQIGNSSYNTFVSKIQTIITEMQYSANNSNSSFYPIYQELSSLDTTLSAMKTTLGYIDTDTGSMVTSLSNIYSKLTDINTSIGKISVKDYTDSLSSIKTDVSRLSQYLTASVSTTSNAFNALYTSVDLIANKFRAGTPYSYRAFGSTNNLTSYGFDNAVIGALSQVIQGLTYIGSQDPGSGGSVNLDTVNQAASGYNTAYQKMIEMYNDVIAINSKLGDASFLEDGSVVLDYDGKFTSSAYPDITLLSDFSDLYAAGWTSAKGNKWNFVFKSSTTLSSAELRQLTVTGVFLGSYIFDAPAGTYTFKAGCAPSYYSSRSAGGLVDVTGDSWQTSETVIELPTGGTFYNLRFYLDGVSGSSLRNGRSWPYSFEEKYTMLFEPQTFSGFTNMFQRLYDDIHRLKNYLASDDDVQRKEDQKDLVGGAIDSDAFDDAFGGTSIQGGKFGSIKTVASTAFTVLNIFSSAGSVKNLPDAFSDAFSPGSDGALSWFTQETASDLDSTVSTLSDDDIDSTHYYDAQMQEVSDWFSSRDGDSP